MELDKIHKLLKETTQPFRKGPEVTTKDRGNVRVTEIFAMPHETQARKDGVEMVNVHFMKVGVDKKKAEARRAELTNFLQGYEPQPHTLEDGPSYIEVGGVLGSQEAALELFALGQALGVWNVITPEVLGITGEQADDLAGRGFVMIEGYKSGKAKASK